MNRFPKTRLVGAFKERLGGDVESSSEMVGGIERFSFYLVSPRFRGMSHLKRQDIAWEIVDSILTRDEALQVSAILALAPGEIKEFVG
jgi:hypothetical protein